MKLARVLQHTLLPSLSIPPQAELRTGGLDLSSLLMFSRSKNVQIPGNPQFIYNDNSISLESESFDEGIRLLVSRVVTGAMHNSRDRFDAPTCHKETRIALRENILGWADEVPVDDLNNLVTWMYGPAGAGKSAIAQTLAQEWHTRGQLTASFFFSRASGSDGRSEETSFVATLAYQLSQTVPATLKYIGEAVQMNPLVFDLSLQDQVDALIVAPLIKVSDPSCSSERPRIIVVDGLDKCGKERDAQRHVVDALVSGVHRVPHHTYKLFITSRPEYNIASIFKKYAGNTVRRMELDNRWNPDDDIRTFLESSFADIRRSHFYFRKRPIDHAWPSPRDVEMLVERSSGQFIYASVVLNYIKSEENYNPVARLQTIFQLEDTNDQPYAELDALHHHIFSQIRDAEIARVLTILHLDQERGALLYGCSMSAPSFETFISEFIGVDEDEIELCLRPLVSLLGWEGFEEGSDEGGFEEDLKEGYEEESEDGRQEGSEEGYEGSEALSGKERRSIHYMHASLPDFLLDQRRSNNFCINMQTFAAGIVRRAIKLLEDTTALKASVINTLPTSTLSSPLADTLLYDGSADKHPFSLL
ncbi:hypothetical protein D9619_000171 [Psilocybe cf. subviscida]|uniref:Nephrocystin 3-like N-terminal domain-containing protein n=1 Tax=Psilocybe cf. subviscida TaxID=2480587 RepID=A0A8H5BDF0_9AGAR|nr:hypothetical protein D9619_000171 [Psilocybe cf. subviscida]